MNFEQKTSRNWTNEQKKTFFFRLKQFSTEIQTKNCDRVFYQTFERQKKPKDCFWLIVFLCITAFYTAPNFNKSKAKQKETQFVQSNSKWIVWIKMVLGKMDYSDYDSSSMYSDESVSTLKKPQNFTIQIDSISRCDFVFLCDRIKSDCAVSFVLSWNHELIIDLYRRCTTKCNTDIRLRMEWKPESQMH